MRLYLDTTVLASFTLFKDKEVKKSKSVNVLLNLCTKRGIKFVTSFYSLHELFLISHDRDAGRDAVLHVLDFKPEVVGFLTREQRLMHQSEFVMKDRTDVPHAIMAHVENCDYIVTYDSHFDAVSDVIGVVTPDELINKLCR